MGSERDRHPSAVVDRSRRLRGKGGQVDRALCYAVVIGGIYALCMLILLDNSPLAIAAGAVVGVLALLRGMAVWG